MPRKMLLLLSLLALRADGQPLFPCAERLQSPYGVCTHITRPTLDRRDDLFHAEWQRSDGTSVHALWSSVGKRQVRVRMGDGACLWDHLGNPLRRRGGRLTVGCVITYVEGELSLP